MGAAIGMIVRNRDFGLLEENAWRSMGIRDIGIARIRGHEQSLFRAGHRNVGKASFLFFPVAAGFVNRTERRKGPFVHAHEENVIEFEAFRDVNRHQRNVIAPVDIVLAR